MENPQKLTWKPSTDLTETAFSDKVQYILHTYMKVKRMRIKEILISILFLSANRVESSESIWKQSSQTRIQLIILTDNCCTKRQFLSDIAEWSSSRWKIYGQETGLRTHALQAALPKTKFLYLALHFQRQWKRALVSILTLC